MTNITKYLLLAAGLTASMNAAVVYPNGPWQSVNGTASGQTLSGSAAVNSAYWNKASQDASNCANIGCYITQQGKFASGYDSPNWDNGVWLGNSDGSAAQNFYFAGQSSGPVVMTAEVAGLSNRNWMGWYDTSMDPGEFTAANKGISWDVIFEGSDSPTSGGTATFNPTGNFGFWFLPNFRNDDILYPTATTVANALNGGDSIFTQGSKNQGYYNNKQYFSLFSASATAPSNPPTTFYMGVEDMKMGDFDFNDMIVKFTVTAVPEPGFLSILGLDFAGLLLAANWLRKKRTANA